MEFEALDGIKLVMLMAAGLLFAVAGIYLLVRPKPEGSAAKIEMFGMKFESSSAGLLVFLIGASFLSIPLFVKEKEPAVAIAVNPVQPVVRAEEKLVQDPATEKTHADRGSGTIPEPLPESSPVVLNQKDVLVQETSATNDTQRTASVLQIGQTLVGRVGKDDGVDWIEVPVPAAGLEGHEIKLKQIEGSFVQADIFNKRDEDMGFLKTSKGAQYLTVKSKFDGKILFRLSGSDYFETAYEFSILAPASN